MTDPIIDRLKRLRADCEAGLDVLKQKQEIGGAINWADLHCHSACSVIDDEAITWYEVIISEAAPDSYELHGWMRTWLTQRGWPVVEVRTEW